MPLLQSLSSLFTGNGNAGSSSRHAARRSVISSTKDAFSLPTTSARFGDGLPPLPDVADSMASSPGPSRRTSYTTYPPPKDAYRPALAYFPPLSHTFHRLRGALADTFPELLETLNAPVDPAMLAECEQELGCPLPPPVRDSFLVADGQDLEACSRIQGAGGIFYGLHLLPLDEVMSEWAFWRQVERDPHAGRNPAVLATMASVPPGWIKNLYACRGWLPLMTDRAGNYVGVDLDPDQGGEYGQVIVFGRDFDRKCVLWRGEGNGGWGKWLAGFVDELESGEGWEADKSAGSDDEEEIGYTSYNGGGVAGELGVGLKLAGEYRGWNVLEAWWDKSVRKWEELGLGLDVASVERGLEEARRLAGLVAEDGNGKGKGKSVEGLGLGMREAATGDKGDVPTTTSPQIPHLPATPVQADVDVLLPPASPETGSVPRIERHAPVPVRIITPITLAEDHPLSDASSSRFTPRRSDSGLLSPPTGRSPPRAAQRRVSLHGPPPAPTPLDLPTRADVQAAHAVAHAEASGLRGGWVMNLDASAGAAQRRVPRGSMDAEMVDIDLEGGKGERFGSPRLSEADSERQREEERLALAGIEHRRPSPQLRPSRTPSPLSSFSAPTTPDMDADQTPRAPPRDPGLPPPSLPLAAAGAGGFVPPTIAAATSAIRRPPPVAGHAERPSRARTPEGERETSVIRGSRMQRESSVVSADSHEGLLDWPGGSAGSPLGGSPTKGGGAAATAADGVEDAEERLAEVSIE